MNLVEFISMGGYGFYVWSSLGMTALLVLLEVISLKRQRVTLLKRLGRVRHTGSGD